MSWSPEGDKGCAFVYERTYFYVDPVGTHAVSPAVAAQYIYELRLDGELRRRSLDPTPGIRYIRQAPTCFTLEAVHLGNATRLVSQPVCLGEEVADELGVRQADVAAALDCAPQICAVKEEHTDPDDCQAYDPAHPPELVTAPVVPKPEPVCPATAVTADGCGCVHTPSALPAWLLVVGLWAWPRRRARPTRAQGKQAGS